MIKEDLYLQINYLKQASSSLLMFKDKGGNIFNMRCPFCGDSQKSRTKARGYCFKSPDDGLLAFKCHNCGIGKAFLSFLKHVDQGLYNRYRFEILKNSKDSAFSISSVMEIDKEAGIEKNLNPEFCKKVTDLSRLHISNLYLDKRKIPRDKRGLFYFTENFASFCESMGNFSDVPNDPRVMLFETDAFGTPKLVIARSISEKSRQRYVTLKFDDSYPKLYGLNRLDGDKDTYVVEGAIDSLFLDNSIATLDANMNSKDITQYSRKPIYVLDNEPRSKTIVEKLRRLINTGNRVVIFDSSNPHKDLNKMVQSGIDLKPYIKSRTYQGVKAFLEFGKWKKI